MDWNQSCYYLPLQPNILMASLDIEYCQVLKLCRTKPEVIITMHLMQCFKDSAGGCVGTKVRAACTSAFGVIERKHLSSFMEGTILSFDDLQKKCQPFYDQCRCSKCMLLTDKCQCQQ